MDEVLFVFTFWDRILYIPGYPRTPYIAKDNTELPIFLPLPGKWWEWRGVPPLPALNEGLSGAHSLKPHLSCAFSGIRVHYPYQVMYALDLHVTPMRQCAAGLLLLTNQPSASTGNMAARVEKPLPVSCEPNTSVIFPFPENEVSTPAPPPEGK